MTGMKEARILGKIAWEKLKMKNFLALWEFLVSRECKLYICNRKAWKRRSFLSFVFASFSITTRGVWKGDEEWETASVHDKKVTAQSNMFEKVGSTCLRFYNPEKWIAALVERNWSLVWVFVRGLVPMAYHFDDGVHLVRCNTSLDSFSRELRSCTVAFVLIIFMLIAELVYIMRVLSALNTEIMKEWNAHLQE